MQPDFWKSLVHPDDRERVLAENERVDAPGTPGTSSTGSSPRTVG